MSTIAECKIESNTYNQRSTAKAVQDLEEGKMAFGRGMDKEIITGIRLDGLYTYRDGEGYSI